MIQVAGVSCPFNFVKPGVARNQKSLGKLPPQETCNTCFIFSRNVM